MAPLVDQQLIVDVEAGAVVDPHAEAIEAGLQGDRPVPAHRKGVVVDEARHWGACAPAVVDGATLPAHKHRCVCQIGVVEVLCRPDFIGRHRGRPAGHRKPEKRDPGLACILEVLDAQRHIALQGNLPRIKGSSRLYPPAIDDELIVDKDTHAVVDRGPKTVGALGEVHRVRPAHRKGVGVDKASSR